MPRVLFLFGFLVNLAVIVGGLTAVAWLGRSLVLYALLDGPLWEVVIVIGTSLFVFARFCVWVVRRRPVGATGKTSPPFAPFAPVQMRLQPFPGKRKFLGEGLENLIKLPHRG
jgi:hypothetical protein